MPDGGDGFYGYLTPDIFSPAEYICGVLRIPNERYTIAAFMGALVSLTNASSWEPFGTMTPDDAAYMCLEIYDKFRESRGACMIGQVFPFITAAPPTNCLLCDGTNYLRVDYPDLYASLATPFIIDADNFVVPDLRGSVIVGANAVLSGLPVMAVASRLGEQSVILDISEIPAHTHTDTAGHGHATLPHVHTDIPALPNVTTIGPGAPQPTAIPGIGITGSASDTILNANVTVDSAGGGAAHDNIQPSFALQYCVVAK
jgi:microcystin-dependent protein